MLDDPEEEDPPPPHPATQARVARSPMQKRNSTRDRTGLTLVLNDQTSKAAIMSISWIEPIALIRFVYPIATVECDGDTVTVKSVAAPD